MERQMYFTHKAVTKTGKKNQRLRAWQPIRYILTRSKHEWRVFKQSTPCVDNDEDCQTLDCTVRRYSQFCFTRSTLGTANKPLNRGLTDPKVYQENKVDDKAKNIHNLSSWTQSVSTRFCAKRKDDGKVDWMSCSLYLLHLCGTPWQSDRFIEVKAIENSLFRPRKRWLWPPNKGNHLTQVSVSVIKGNECRHLRKCSLKADPPNTDFTACNPRGSRRKWSLVARKRKQCAPRKIPYPKRMVWLSRDKSQEGHWSMQALLLVIQ